MGLLAVIVAKTREGGGLHALTQRLPFFAVLCFALAGSLLYTLPSSDRYTYFSENALLPHQSKTYFRESDWAVVNGIRNEISAFADPEIPDSLRVSAIKNLFEVFGFHAHTHATKKGTNVYAYLRASRGPQNEAIVLAAPWIVPGEGSELDSFDITSSRGGSFNEGGVAVLLGLARRFKEYASLHKNIVFVIPADPRTALREWVQAYHTNLRHTAGSISGVVVLDYAFSADRFDLLDIGFEGLNGEQPNLDLVNVAVNAALAESVDPRVLGVARDADENTRRCAVYRNIVQQALAGIGADYSSAMFSGWRIDAVTLRAIPGNHGNNDITTFGRVAESIIQSVNSLIERLHQSFFLYLLLDPQKFVSVAQFLPAALLASSAFTFMALYAFYGPRYKSPSALQILVAALGLGSLVAACTAFAHIYAAEDSSWPGFLVCGVLVCLVVLLASLPRTLKDTVYMVVLIYLGASFSALAVVNFSLALIFACICAPLLVAGPGVRGNGLALAISHPVLVFTLLGDFQLRCSPVELINRMAEAYMDLDVWTWPLVCALYIPAWIATACACLS